MIREATAADLPRMEAGAREFYASSKFLVGFDPEKFVRSWAQLLASGLGVILMTEDQAGPTGAIGGACYPDINSGELVAMEFFWFVRPGSRGGGLQLLHAFERWAREKGCRHLRVCHLLDSMPEKLEKVYRRLGFQAAEIHYTKEL